MKVGQIENPKMLIKILGLILILIYFNRDSLSAYKRLLLLFTGFFIPIFGKLVIIYRIR